MRLAARHGWTVYDAAYLNSRCAGAWRSRRWTGKLRAAAQTEGVVLLGA